MSDQDSLQSRFMKSARLDDCPIYDLHGHWGPFGGAYLPQSETDIAIKTLDRAGVAMFAFCGHLALTDPELGNAENVRVAREHSDKMRAYCCVNPHYPDQIARDLASYQDNSDAYVGFKMHPPWHSAALTDDGYRPVWEYANARGLIVLSHTWGNAEDCGFDALSEVAGRYSDVKIIAGHSLHDRPDQAMRIVKERPNVYLDTCAMLDDVGVIDRIVAEIGSERILFGTDFPWFGHHYHIGALLGAGISDDDRRNILYRNARRLLG